MVPLLETRGSGSAFAFGLNSFGADFGAYYPLQTLYANGTSTSLNFTGISQEYKHLEIRYFIRTNFSSEDTLYAYGFDVNAGGSTNSTVHWFGSDRGATPIRANSTGNFSSILGYVPGTNQLAGTYGAGIMKVHNYSSGSRNKTILGWGGWNEVSAGKITMFGNTPMASFTSNAWDRVQLITNGNMVSGSYATLYGIKG